MSYEELAKLWRDQRKKLQEWERNLIGCAVSLRDSVKATLAPPNETWSDHDGKFMHPYIGIVNFYRLDEPEWKLPSNDAITPDGVFLFGIGITFDMGTNAYPKHRIYVPVAARVTNKGAEYSFFDKETDGPDNNWSQSVDAFSIRVIDRVRKYLSHDPYSGFGNKVPMGFVR